MPSNFTSTLFRQRKRRVFGELIKEAEVTNSNAWVTLHRSSKELLLTYESKGLVVSLNGGGGVETSHPDATHAATLAQAIVEAGGVVLNGGRSKGIMETATEAAGKNVLGVIFPELKSEMIKFGATAVVNAPTPRIDVLGTCAPIIVVFRGGLGTFQVLLRAIAHLKNRKFNPEQSPQMMFVSEYWVGLLSSMMNLGVLPREFLTELKFFSRAEQIISAMPAIK